MESSGIRSLHMARESENSVNAFIKATPVMDLESVVGLMLA